MNKLVVMAVALVAAASSFAQCTPGETPASSCAQVYTVEMKLKTTIAKSGQTDVGSECSPLVSNICYRVISSKSYKGYLWNCECGCDTFEANTLELFDKKTDLMVVTAGGITWDILGRINQKNSEVEAAGEFAMDDASPVYLMGFGKYDSKNDRISSISGDAQAFLPAPFCTIACAPGPGGYPRDLCDPSIALPVATIGYGSFSIKYNSSASKKQAADDTYIYTLLPL